MKNIDSLLNGLNSSVKNSLFNNMFLQISLKLFDKYDKEHLDDLIAEATEITEKLLTGIRNE